MNPTSQKSVSKLLVAWHALLWLAAGYLYVQILGFEHGGGSNLLISGMYLIQFGVHEAGHMIFMFLPDILTALAGSFSEVAFTVLIVIAALRSKSYWAAVFGLLWVMLALMSVGSYMADARAQEMLLMGPSPDPIHDWNFIFGQLGWLQADVTLGTITKVIGGIAGAAGLMLGLTRIGKR